MKTLNTYLGKHILATVAMALGILTFVMLSGHFFRAFDLLSRGVSPLLMGKFLVYLLPDMLRFTLPLALLVSTVLVFSRFSADNEIVAMKSMGISIWQIVSPALMLSFGICCLCLWLSLFVSPLFRYRSEQLRWSALAETPLALLEPGVFVEVFPNCSIKISGRDGNELQGIHIVFRGRNGGEYQDIVSEKGRVLVNPEEEHMELALINASVTNFRLDVKPAPKDVRFLSAYSISIPMNYGRGQGGKKLLRKPKYMDLKMLCARIAISKENGEDVDKYLVDLHKRLALALSPFSFLLLGLPFGIRSKRSELSVGLLICVLLALVFYAFMLLSDAVKGLPGGFSQYTIWIPNLLYQSAGLVMIRKLDSKG